MGYEQLLVWQYKDKPKALALMEGFSKESELWQKAAIDLIDCLDIETADDNNLDLVGEHVGVSRFMKDAVPLYLFGFRAPLGGFSKGGVGGARFWRIGNRLASSVRLEDTEYRLIIKSAIIKLWSTNTIPGLQKATNALLGPGSARVTDNEDMSITVDILRGVALFERFALESLDILPRPPAIKLILNFTVEKQ